jgi:Holliday junction resolvase
MFAINSIQELESLSQKVKWQYFEKLVAFIFEQNGFDAKQNVVIVKGKSRKQFDVIATRYDKTYLVECKKWKSRKNIGSSLKAAAKEHKGRCEFYKNACGKASPLIVTLKDVDIEADIPVMPVTKLNAYINEEL